ncbi:MAG: hypothetical protein R3286_20365 [Gammaproteobacteria bacterium]|nr:hypothetical protein [Gammaproteobacteria bacterium]
MFELLFKYPPDVYARGELTLAAPAWLLAVIAAAIIVLVPTLLGYARVAGLARRADRVVLVGLRAALLALIALALMQPALLVTRSVSQGKVLALLLDDSLSMRIADEGDRARGELVREAFDPATGASARALASRFDVRPFRFGADTAALASGAELGFTASRTDLAAALAAVREELGASSLAGVVMVTDGAANGDPAGADAALERVLAEYRVAEIPVSTVGIGRSRFTADVEVSRVTLPERILAGSSVGAEVLVSGHGTEGRRLELVVEDDGRVIAVRPFRMPPGRTRHVERAELRLADAGARQLTFRVAPVAGETVIENNARHVTTNVRAGPDRILYFEGEPRFEVKFLRRAVARDHGLHVVSLIRTAESKYYRLGIDDPQELADGFPRSREALFGYRGLVIGSVEASYFTAEQLDMIADFVSRRGGGLLLLGGKRALAQGGFADTPLADLVPAHLPARVAGGFHTRVRVQPTLVGRDHPVLGSLRDAAGGWDGLPALTALHPITVAKPGASVLLEGIGPDVAGPLVVLAEQRFGRGRTMLLNVHDSWRWQMSGAVALDDQTHEELWRRLLRWLVRAAPEPVTIDVEPADAVPGETVRVTVAARDGEYRARNNATLSLSVISPVGDRASVPLEWQPEGDGIYEARFVPEQAGPYELGVESPAGEGSSAAPATAQTFLQVGAMQREYYRAEMREPQLRRIAEATGGRFFTSAELGTLARDIPSGGTGTEVVERLALWNLPAALLALLALVCAEWVYRRMRGLI